MITEWLPKSPERVNKIIRVLEYLSRINKGKTKNKELIIEIFESSGKGCKTFNFDRYERGYKLASKLHKKKYLKEYHIPPTEKRVKKELSFYLPKFKSYSGYLIGNVVVDIFFPTFTYKRGDNTKWKGLAIEVDGNIHNTSERKIKKDTWKVPYLASLGIPVYRIDATGNISEIPIKILQKTKEIGMDARNWKTMQHHTKQNFLRKIYIETIARNENVELILDRHFNLDFKTIDRIYSIIT